jgi:ABC-type uncharacterized transport system substrate-binding protein
MRLAIKTMALTVCALMLGGLMAGDAQRKLPLQRRLIWLGTSQEGADAIFNSVQAIWAKQITNPCSGVKVEFFHFDGTDFGRTAKELAKLAEPAPDFFVAVTANSAHAVRQLAPNKSLVFASYLDPVHLGLVGQAGRLEVPATGLDLHDRVDAVRLELLVAGFPGLKKVGLLADRAWLDDNEQARPLVARAQTLGVVLQIHVAENEAGLKQLFAALGKAPREAPEAWYVPATDVDYVAQRTLIDFLRTNHLPAMHAVADDVHAGALMAYDIDTTFADHALADLVMRVCAGEPAGAIPLERPRRYRLIIRSDYDTGRQRIHADVLARADLIAR